MVLKSTTGSNVAVYQVSGSNSSRSLPDWIARKRRSALKKDVDYANRVELIQDFEFQEASNKIQVTRDGQYCMATGTYKPQIHVYDFEQLSLKFDRHTDAENVDFCIISDDWTKSVHLQNDRTLEFHAQGGIHTRSRIPKFGRALVYNRGSCDLYVGASGNEVYRLNLDQGRFLAPFAGSSEGVNCLDVNPAHGLLGFGSDQGVVEFWDPRSRTAVGILNLDSSDNVTMGNHSNTNNNNNGSVGATALSFGSSGISWAVGTSDGRVMTFDLRSSQPLLVKDQGYGYAIKKIIHLEDANSTRRPQILSADRRIVKIWDAQNGHSFTSMEPTVDINDVAHVPGSGMFFLANEGMPMHTYYIPSIGPAPKWCSFLENLTEELEEKPVTSVYENYKFVTKKDLKALNLHHLIGSSVVKSYMHGYFIDVRLYEQAKLISDPYAYRDHREREIKKRIDKDRASRIRSSGGVVKAKVNKELAKSMVVAQDQSAETPQEPAIDDRFKAMFEDPEFEIDENSYEYKLLHPAKPKQGTIEAQQADRREKERGLTAAERELESESESGQNSESESESENESNEKTKRSSNKAAAKKNRTLASQQSPAFNGSGKLQSVYSSRQEESFDSQIKTLATSDISTRNASTRISKAPNGEAQITFVPSSKPKPSKVRGKSRDMAEDGAEDENGTGNTDKGRTKQRFDGRRRASKNVFRGM